MVKNKSHQSERLSSRTSDVLNEDSNLVDSDDPSWYNRTAVRPSTSQNPSESSRLQAEALKSKTKSGDGERSVEDSESEHVLQKRRANIKSAVKQTAKSDISNAFTRALEDTTDSSQSTRGNPKASSKPGPRFTKLAKHGTTSLDSRASENASTSGRIVSRTINQPGPRFRKSGEISDERLQELIKPFQPSFTKTSKSSSSVSSHSKYSIVLESSTSSEDEMILPLHSKRKTKSVERIRSKTVMSKKKENTREKTPKEGTHLSFVKGTAELEKNKEADGSKSLTSSLHSITVQHGSNETSSKSKSSKHDERDKQQLPDLESSDEEMYTSTVQRTRQKKTDANGKSEKFRGKPRKRLFREKKTSEPEDVLDPTSFSESPASKDTSKGKEVELSSRSSQRSQTVTNTSQKGQSASASKRKSTSRESSAEVSDGEKSGSTSTTVRLQNLRKRLFERSNDSIDDDLDVAVDEFEGGLELDNVPENRSGSSRTSHKSAKKSTSTVRDTPAHQSLSKIARLAVPTGIENNQLSSRKSTVVSGSSKPASSISSDRRSVETSTDGTMITVSPRGTSTPMPYPGSSRGPPATHPEEQTSAKSSHDSSHTPDQSTLKSHNKRLMLFSFDTTDDEDSEEERAPIAPHEDDGGLDVSNLAPHLRRFLNVPSEEKSQGVGNVDEAEMPIDWDRAKKHTDEVITKAIVELRVAKDKRRKLELQKQRIDDGFRRLQARKEYRRKLRKKKPIDKAFLVDGKVYKPPGLPRPKPWATDKLYKYLMKRMEKKCGLRTKVKSERFVVRLANFATMIAKRKKYEKYAVELEELMVTMAKLGIIETRYDFYRFCSEFMPYSFREKVVPIAVPGNKRNMPYFAELTNVPLVNEENVPLINEENVQGQSGSDSDSEEL